MKKYLWYISLTIFLFLEWFFPIFTYFALQTLPIFWLIALSTLIGFLFWLIIFIKEKLYVQYHKKEILFPTFLSVLFLWSAWVMYFFWIKYSSPSTASILLLLQTFYAFVIFNLLWKEDYSIKQVLWALLMLVGWIVILYKWDSFVNLWALIMIITSLFFTIWSYYTKKASLAWANPFFLLINRNLLMLIATTILAFVFVGPVDISLIKHNIVWIILIWFFILFLSKTLWIVSLSKLDWFVAISMLPIIPLLVMIFSFIVLQKYPTYQEVLWFIPIFIGAILLLKKR